MRSPALLLASVLASHTLTPFVHAQQVQGIDVVWAGTYSVAGSREVEDPVAPAGHRFVASGVQPLLETERVAAAVGTRFGVGYVLRGEPEGQRIPVQVYWRFPPRGITNPDARTTTFEWKTPPADCPLEGKPFCLVGYPLQHDWELVPGRWTIEIWAEGRKLLERSFDVYVP